MGTLESYWTDLCNRYTKNTSLINEWFEVIVNAYSQKHRQYHNLEHILSMILKIEENQERITNKDALLFATWFHDIVYNPKKKDNEAQSAELAEEALLQLFFPLQDMEKVKELINATANHVINNPAQNSDLSFFLDCDLKILGSTRSEYLRYTEQIREEYRHVPSFIYSFERKKILKRFIQSENIYRTENFRNKYEQQARSNILHEIQSL